MRNIHVIMTREDGSEEGNQWEFDGLDDSLYNLFDHLCRTIINWPIGVVLPEPQSDEGIEDEML